MADPHWTAYAGIAAGITGAITGIAGAIMGYVGYRNSTQAKALDLRLELRKAVNEVDAVLPTLEELLNHADKSRKAIAAAMGAQDSGAMVKWNAQVEADRTKVKQLTKQAPTSRDSFGDLSPFELESRLVAIHKMQGQIDDLVEKYSSSLRADDERRKAIRENASSRA